MKLKDSILVFDTQLEAIELFGENMIPLYVKHGMSSQLPPSIHDALATGDVNKGLRIWKEKIHELQQWTLFIRRFLTLPPPPSDPAPEATPAPK